MNGCVVVPFYNLQSYLVMSGMRVNLAFNEGVTAVLKTDFAEAAKGA
jgi:hypothetical protein